jgi:hypothetical protein
MQSETFALFQCWNADRISQVINKEAASVDKATFLATHAPINKLTYERTPYRITDTSENGLLKELRMCATEQRHAFVVVLGIPGTGKSHLIRWLKERYTFENEQQECVLFIERAQCSLSGTLEQIIKSGVFDDEAMREQLKKLQNASIALSDHALANTLLDQIRITAEEFQARIMTGELEQPVMPRWLARNNRFEIFMLDFTVRQELMKPGGPIDRIRRFLEQGPDSGMQGGEIPKFEARDFDFKSETLKAITGYEEALYVAERLFGEDGNEQREELAYYLNHILPEAIGRATTLTSDDFKRIFYDLRRHLRKQGRHLALFIEDITVLTGIDVGLLDVLATQHTGESGQELCRLISVVGITDNYYSDYFPQNMKDRVTHRITLNATQTMVSDSELLSDPSTTADMAARYLNAIRLKKEQLDVWLEQGAKPEQTPNACDTCRMKAICHAAFGAKQIPVGTDQALHMGLYPFNEQAIWNFYRHINTANNKRTPRSLLNNVLYYVLQSHGPRIAQGLFPPAPGDLGGEFTPFTLAKSLQRSLLEQQGGDDAKRIETLVIIWGDGTVDASQKDGNTLIGGLSSSIFRAFGIKLISGERPPESSTPRRGASQQQQAETVSPRYGDAVISSRKKEQEISFSIPKKTGESPASSEKHSEYEKDITTWLRGGKLTRYEYYNESLAQVIRTFIDWDFYGISNTQVEELFRGYRRIYIEDQAGKVNAAHYITFERSTELANVLLALVAMKESSTSLADELLGAHFTNLSIWLHKHEAAIVQFVRQPANDAVDSLPLTHLLLLDCLLLACLQGALQTTYSSTGQMFQDLLKFCITTINSTGQMQPGTQQEKHSDAWNGLRNQTQKTATALCQNLLYLLNCPQGGSAEVRFVDAATALQILDSFRQGNWQLPSTAISDTQGLKMWEEAIGTFKTMQEEFDSVLHSELEYIQTLLDNLANFLGYARPEEVFQAIDDFVKELIAHKRGTNFEIRQTLKPTGLRWVLSELQGILSEGNRERQILRLSSSSKLITTAQEYLEYFKGFVKEATKQRKLSSDRLNHLQASVNAEISSEPTRVKEMYQEIEELLAQVTVKESIG